MHKSLLLIGSLLLAGCGGADLPDMGQVTGTVTLDGKPLPNAVVTFQPEHARPSYGRTDESGKYDLIYTSPNRGAVIGKHTVKISCTDAPATDGEGEQEYGAAAKEILPAKYNLRTELTADVKAGRQTIDFALDSQGEVEQERPGG